MFRFPDKWLYDRILHVFCITPLSRAGARRLAADGLGPRRLGARQPRLGFALYASGGVPAWRGRLRWRFERYTAVANAVLRTLNRGMLDMDLSSLRGVPWAPRRTVTPPAPPLSGLVHYAHEDADLIPLLTRVAWWRDGPLPPKRQT